MISCVFFSFFELSNLQDTVAPREWPLFIEQFEHEALVFVAQHRKDDGRRREPHWLNNSLSRSLLEALPWSILQTVTQVVTHTVVAGTWTRFVFLMCCVFNRGPPTVQSRTKMRHFDGVWGSIVRSHSVDVFQSLHKKNLFYFQLFSQGRGLTGLKNMGNTCYMSSTIQCLSNTPVLINYLIDKKYLHDINRCVSLYLFMFQSMHAFFDWFTHDCF